MFVEQIHCVTSSIVNRPIAFRSLEQGSHYKWPKHSAVPHADWTEIRAWWHKRGRTFMKC